MKKENKRPKLTQNECEKAVCKFFESQQKFKQTQAYFNKIKAQFNSDMEDFFKYQGISKMVVSNFANGNLVVNRVQKSSVEFDAEKLEKALGKKIAKQVVIKRCEIIDIDALISYLKECNVDPKVFKSFLNVSKEVDTQELDRLEELGKITVEQIKGCYTVKHQNPYFTVGMKKGQGNE